MPSNPQTLFEQAKCFACYGLSEYELLKLALLDTISGGSTPVTPCANLEGPEADPTGIYTPEFIGQVYVTTGHVWQATGLTDADWTEICADCVSGVLTFQVVTLDRISIVQDGADTQVSFPNLTDILGVIDQGSLEITDSSSITTVSAPLLEFIDFGVNLTNNTVLTSINLLSLQTVFVSRLIFFGCSSLVTLNLSSLVTVGSDVDGSGCTALTTFSCPLWSPTGGTTVNFNNCALNAASVNQILARCISVLPTTMTIDLAGGTNAAPTGQGIIDKAALIALGNAVSTN